MGSDVSAVCRTLGHAWYQAPDDAAWSSRRVWNFRLVLQCERCGTRRLDGIDAYGRVGSRQYDYAAGYSYPADAQPSRAELRLAMLRPPEDRARPAPSDTAAATAVVVDGHPVEPPAAAGGEPGGDTAADPGDVSRPRRRAGPRRMARA